MTCDQFLRVLTLVVSGSIAAGPRAAVAQNPTEPADARLEQMRRRAAEVDVQLADSDTPAELEATPAIRYDDPPRGFEDATMWVYTVANRPVAFHKVEAMLADRTRESQWGHCLASACEEEIAFRWPGGGFRSQGPGARMETLADVTPARGSTQRRLQARGLAQRFSGRIFEVRSKQWVQMRLLPRPLYEYSDPRSNRYRGAVFGLTTHGTNPDVLLMLEASDSAEGDSLWRYNAVRMTNGGVRLRFDERVIQQFDPLEIAGGRFDTWLFFSVPRSTEDVEEVPRP